MELEMTDIMMEIMQIETEYGLIANDYHSLLSDINHAIFEIDKELIKIFSSNSGLEITKEFIRNAKIDIIDYKNEFFKGGWIVEQDKRDHFVVQYMLNRKLNSDFGIYSQLVYICMCQDWKLEVPRPNTENNDQECSDFPIWIR